VTVMKIVVLSDSHTTSIDGLPRKIIDEISGADLTIHAGDYTEKRLVDDLRGLCDFKGVYGNRDSPEIRRELPALEVVEAGGFHIGVSHPAEGGPPFGITTRVTAKLPKVEMVVFGHTHRPRNGRKRGVLYFNPGSATGRFPALRMTFGVITVGDEIRAKVLRADP